MTDPYHARGHLRALLRSAVRHLRDWRRQPEYRALYQFQRKLRHHPRFTPGTVSFAGRSIDFLDAPSFLSAWDEIFVNRIYDLPPPAANPLLVDVGANIGLAALFWKQRFGAFRYLGFEPDPGAAAIARRNLAAWDCPATLQSCAVGAVDGRLAFVRDRADGGHLTVAAPPSGAIVVEVRRLSPFLDQPVDLLKVDIEGAETGVLQEAAPVLHHVRNIFVEVHCPRNQPHELAAVLTLLHAAGFRTFVRPLLTPPHPFAGDPPGGDGPHDQLLNVFGVRR